MGEKDLQRQRDPGDGLSAEERASSVNEDDNDDAADALGRSQPPEASLSPPQRSGR